MTLTDEERFPELSQTGRELLKRLREHPHAPRYSARCGHRLTADYLQRVRDYEATLAAGPKGWQPDTQPGWLDDFVALCFRDVPFYRRYGERPARWADVPTFGRADLSREPWAFVPDPLSLDDLIVNATSGTTGHPLVIPSHPVVGACYTPLLKAALALHGIALTSGSGQVACILVGYQQRAYTYPSVSPQQDEAGHVKLNLHPADWRDPADRAKFLDDCNPEIYTGDPVAFAELMKLPLQSRPRALISTAMRLLPGLRQQLEEHFNCPVLDVYSMNECGPIAVDMPSGQAQRSGARLGEAQPSSAFQLLQPYLYIEILDAEGQPCRPGERGEVTLTGGLNFYLPLLRYRTNDDASLEWYDGQPHLVGLEGRPPVLFRGMRDQVVSPLDVSKTLAPFALSQFTLHQSADQALHLKVRRAGLDLAPLRASLLALFGDDQSLVIEETDAFGDKVIQYTSEIALQ